MHVVDAVATYRPSVVAEVVLDSWVPHLKSRDRKEGHLSASHGGYALGAQALGSVNIPGHLFIIQQTKQLLVKNKHSEPHCFNIGPAFPIS